MSVDCFLDTNTLVYAVSSLEEDSHKQATALDLVRHADFGLSAQVLQEFYVTVTLKIQRPMAPRLATEMIAEYRRFPLALTDYPLIVMAIERALRFRVSYWDGAILAAAETLGAKLLYSEDLSHGQQYGAVRVENPFLGAAR